MSSWLRTVRGVGRDMLIPARNPTGQVISGEELKGLVRLGDGDTTMILDEFYSWYIYGDEVGKSVSGAAYVDDVNKVGRPPRMTPDLRTR